MGMLLTVVGAVWAFLGVANIMMMPWGNMAPDSPLASIGLMFNMLVFIIPGLVVAGIGQMVGKRQKAQEAKGAAAAEAAAHSRKCPYCAETIKREAVVCRFCGHELPQIDAATIAATNAQPTADDGLEKAKRKTSFSNWTAVLVAVFGVSLVGLVIQFQNVRRGESAAETTIGPQIETVTPAEPPVGVWQYDVSDSERSGGVARIAYTRSLNAVESGTTGVVPRHATLFIRQGASGDMVITLEVPGQAFACRTKECIVHVQFDGYDPEPLEATVQGQSPEYLFLARVWSRQQFLYRLQHSSTFSINAPFDDGVVRKFDFNVAQLNWETE